MAGAEIFLDTLRVLRAVPQGTEGQAFMIEGEMAADRGAVPLTVTGETAEVVVFALGVQRFALRTADVYELLHAFAFDPLPSAPEVVAGAANLRGEVVPVVDLRSRFGLAPKPLEPSDHFVVARAERFRVILHVDRVLELRRVTLTEFRASSGPSGLVAGAGTVEDGILFIYDLSGLLSRAEGLSLERALAEPRPEASA